MKPSHSGKRNMKTQNTASQTVFGASIWLWLSIAAALLAIAGSIVALAVKSIYAGLTPIFLPQALAQDIANLALVAPLWLLLAALALRGSLRAYLLWLGVLTFTVYNYVIYTFSIPFGPLFLLWVAVFGMSIYALIGGIATVDHQAVKSAFTSRRATLVTAWVLIITAVLFGLALALGRCAGLAFRRAAPEPDRHGAAHQPGPHPRPGVLPAGRHRHGRVAHQAETAGLHPGANLHRLSDPDRHPHPAHPGRADRARRGCGLGRRPAHRRTHGVLSALLVWLLSTIRAQEIGVSR